MERFIELLTTKYNTYTKIKVLISFIKDIDCHSREYSLELKSISLFNIMNGNKVSNYDFLLKLKQEETEILNVIHNLYRENYQDLFEGDYRDNLNNPLSTHKQLLCDLIKILKKQLESTEEYKMKMEQQRMLEEEERMRLVMKQEKEIQKLKDYALKQKIKKTTKVPCPNCGEMKSYSNLATHMTMKVCINFGKKVEEVRKKGHFTCEFCGKEQSNTNRQNHLSTQKCMKIRGLIE
jgi:predicted RNA-binding Zn-ribbon protein involved in translation (DUF1610 family)